jgi:two-component system copper resistance phosphate regulon response regulator CusR
MKLLIVDDELKTTDYLKKGLAEQGCSVDIAHDGLEGRHLALEHDYDVIVLDAMLPALDGFQLLRELRRVRRRRSSC